MSGAGTASDLAGQVSRLRVPPGHLAVWALGQQGYLFKGGEHVVVVDPYLSNYVQEIVEPEEAEVFARLVAIPVRPEDLSMVGLALVTHEHADHCDPKTLVPLLTGAATSARVVASYKARDALVRAGIDEGRIRVPPVGERFAAAEGLEITAIPSAHYEFEPDGAGNPAYLGFILRINGVTVYHSGDSVVYSGLEERLRAEQIDVACLPINGRDYFREQQGLVGNMDYREAAELAARAGVKVLIPGHNDMFAPNRINASYFVDYVAAHFPRQRFHFLQAGELYFYAG